MTGEYILLKSLLFYVLDFVLFYKKKVVKRLYKESIEN